MKKSFCVLVLFTLTFQALGQGVHFKCFDEFSQSEVSILRKKTSDSPEIILLGESHGVSGNHNIFYQIVEFLVKERGIRYIVLERSYSDAYLLNIYLRTGDEKFLKYDPSWSEEMRESYRKIYLLNLNLLEERKIKFLGVDGIRSISAVVTSLQDLMPKDIVPPKSIFIFIDSLKRIQTPIKPPRAFSSDQERLKEIENNIVALANEIRSKENEYRIYFAGNFAHVDQIISNKASLRKENRNSDMYENFVKLVSDFKIKESLFGFFGSTHVYRQSRGNFTDLLNRDLNSTFKNKVSVVGIEYNNCKTSNFSKWDRDELKPSKAIKQVMVTSPFSECPNFFLEVPNTSQYSYLAKLYDYVLLISGKEGIKRIKD